MYRLLRSIPERGEEKTRRKQRTLTARTLPRLLELQVPADQRNAFRQP
jgi:hypothetical protein